MAVKGVAFVRPDIRKVAAVFEDGNVAYPSELFTEIRVKPFAAPVMAVTVK